MMQVEEDEEEEEEEEEEEIDSLSTNTSCTDYNGLPQLQLQQEYGYHMVTNNMWRWKITCYYWYY